MLKTGLHFLFSSLGVLTLWVLDVPFFTGAWIRCFCSTGFGFAALFLVGGYLWLKRARAYHRHAALRGSLHWEDDETLELAYQRR